MLIWFRCFSMYLLAIIRNINAYIVKIEYDKWYCMITSLKQIFCLPFLKKILKNAPSRTCSHIHDDWRKRHSFTNSFYLIEKMKEFPKKMSWNKSATMKNIMLFLEMKKKAKKRTVFLEQKTSFRRIWDVYETSIVRLMLAGHKSTYGNRKMVNDFANEAWVRITNIKL